MQSLFMLSLEKELHARKVEDMMIFFIARLIKTNLRSDIFQGTHFCFVFHQSFPKSRVCCKINIRAK